MQKAIIVTGIREIDKKLKTLEPAVQKKVVRKSIRAGLKIMATATKAQVPVLSGLTKSAIKVRAVKKRKRGSIELEVMISGKVEGLTRPGKRPVFYPAVVEYKHDHFMQRAYEASGEAARQVALASLLKGIEEEAAK